MNFVEESMNLWIDISPVEDRKELEMQASQRPEKLYLKIVSEEIKRRFHIFKSNPMKWSLHE